MSILDEIKKKAEYYGEFDIRKGNVKEQHIFKAVKLSDIEKILGEKCIWKEQRYEWKTGCGEYNSYQTITDHFDKDNWKFCPYCGREIQEQFEVKE